MRKTEKKDIGFKVLDVKIDAVQTKRAVDLLGKWIKSKETFKYIVSTNANNIIDAVESEKYKRVMKNSALSLPDSVPFLWIGQKNGFDTTERCGIQEVMEALFEQSKTGINYRHYFYGNTPKVLDKMQRNLFSKYPNLKIVGMYSPPFRPLTQEENREIVNRINSTNPDYLWVSLGCPKQEQWLYDNRNNLCPMVAGGAGAVFNFIAGETKRAPRWVQMSGLEWLYRLFLSPKKLSNRYLVKYPKFIYLFSKNELKRLMKK